MPIPQDPILTEQEADSVSPLGSLESEYKLDATKFIIGISFSALFIFFIPILRIWEIADHKNHVISSVLFFVILAQDVLLLAFYLYNRRLRVIVYTKGFIYTQRRKSRSICWQQIKRVSTTYNKSLDISIRNAAGITLPSSLTRFAELETRIKQESATPSATE